MYHLNGFTGLTIFRNLVAHPKIIYKKVVESLVMMNDVPFSFIKIVESLKVEEEILKPEEIIQNQVEFKTDSTSNGITEQFKKDEIQCPLHFVPVRGKNFCSLILARPIHF